MKSFVEINYNNIDILKKFLSNMGSSKKSFRYYNKRKIKECLSSHIKTCVLLEDDEAIGYGHLDKDRIDNKVWLGVCLKSSHVGKGNGSILMSYLLKNFYENIYLSVDVDNLRGLGLYKKFNFKEVSRNEKYILMSRKYADTNL